jgi:hypothetical protein
VWINPRAFDAEMDAKLAAAKGAEATFLQTFQRYWKALDSVALTAGWDKDLDIAVAVRGQAEKLPEPGRRFFATAAKSSSVWQRFPDDALFAVAGRIDLPALWNLVSEFATKPDRDAMLDALERTLGAALGKNVVREILPHVGPDWGLCISAPPAKDRNWFPHTVFAVRVESGGESLLELLSSYALAAVLNHNRVNKDQMALKRVTIDKAEVKYLVNDQRFAPGLQPAFALVQGHLVLASSPDAVRRFLSTDGKGKPDAAEFPLLRVSWKSLRQYVKDRREPLIAAVAEKNQLSPEEAAKRLDGLLAGLSFVDLLELTQRGSPGQTTWTLRLQTNQPLKKDAGN